ncbi:hypothetical protein [Caulobacter sp. RL271]|uniref:Uncharacterized protein n=1 Tax=Caulobacter segnis TaxID=88688 RepID=A0ABY4ZX51_9CAUL|nr:hypothetical protein [Caulobacter segnis]USQ97280.1 hypothetical protein MZV50_06975 [Caulobacter segnis]
MTLRPGMSARVVNVDGIRLPGKGKVPFVVGDLVKINKLTRDGKQAQTSAHPGWFAAFRFEPL